MPDQRVQVTVTLPSLEYFVKNIGGNQVSVNVLMRNGADPETFEPGISAMKRLGDSDLIFSTGLMPFEQQLIDKNNHNGLTIAILTDSISLITGTHDLGSDNHHNIQHHTDVDPHVWVSASNARIMARAICNALSSADSANAGYYHENLASFEARVDSLQALWAGELASAKGKCFAIDHPSLSYFARDYDMVQMAINNGHKENSAQGLAETLSRIKSARPLVYFVEYGSDSRKSQLTADAIDVPPTEINTLTPDWEAMMSQIVTAIASANELRTK